MCQNTCMINNINYFCFSMKFLVLFAKLAIILAFLTASCTQSRDNYLDKAKSNNLLIREPYSDDSQKLYDDEIIDVALTDSGTIFALSNKNRIYINDVQVGRWDTVILPDFKSQRLFFLNAEVGFVIGKLKDKGVVWKTSNRGKDWYLLSELIPIHNVWQFMQASQIYFVDEKIGYVIETFTIWKTVDGGINWKQIYIVDKTNTWQPIKIKPFSVGEVYVIGTNGIFGKMVDGFDWKQQNILQKDIIGQTHSLYDIQFINENIGWVSSSSQIELYYTSDGGSSWKVSKQPENGPYLQCFFFLNETDGWGIWEKFIKQDKIHDDEFKVQKYVAKTTNSGKSWQVLSPLYEFHSNLNPAFENKINQIYFVDEINGWFIDEKSVFKTKDGGKTWVKSLIVSK